MTSTDGNTAIQVSPIPTETEMSTIRSMFDRAANAIVQASELNRDLTILRHEFDAFKQDMDSQRRRNQELDEMLTHVRAQRDKAEAELSHSQSELHSVQMQAQGLHDTNAVQAETIARLREELDETKTEKSEVLDMYYCAEDEADKAKAKLANFQSLAMDAFGLYKPEPVPAPKPNYPLGVSNIQELKPENVHAEQAQASEAKRVYQYDAGFDWNKPYKYDANAGQHYQEA